MASEDTSQFLLQKVSCPQCKGVLKNPKRLSCLHDACSSCLDALRRGSGSRDFIVCPKCKEERRLEKGNVDDLPDSPYITSLCEVHRIMKSKTSLMKCLFCETEPASLQGTHRFCPERRRFLCDTCLHNAEHKKHCGSVVDFQVGTDNDFGDILKPPSFCSEEHHEEEELKLFCPQCNAAICMLCSQTSPHDEHQKKSTLKEATKCFKPQMEALIEKQLQAAKKKMDEVAQLGQECDEVDRQAKEVASQVRDFFKCISERLEAEKEKVLAEVKDVATRSLELLKRRKRLIQNQGEVVRLTMETTSTLLKHSTSSDVIFLNNALEKVTTEITKEEEEDSYDAKRKPLQMSFVKTQELCDILDTKGIGSLQTQSETCAEKSTVDGEGILKATVGIEARFQLTTKNASADCYYLKTDRITVEGKNESGADCVTGVRIQDNEDGSYELSYFAKVSGVLSVSVKVNSEHVCGSPFAVKVEPRKFRPVKSFGKTQEENTERWGLAVSDDNAIAVTQAQKRRVQLFSNTGDYSSFGCKSFDSPAGVVFDRKGKLLVADTNNGIVHKFIGSDYEGKFGDLDNPSSAMSPQGLSIDQEGNIIIAYSGNREIKIFSPEGEFLKKFGGTNKEEGSLKYPLHCVQSGSYLAVSDVSCHAVKVFNREGGFLYSLGVKGNGEGQFNGPRCLAVDKLGHLLVCDTGNNRVQLFELNDSDAEFKGSFGKGASSESEIEDPFSIGVLSDGRFVVNDTGKKHIQIIE